MINVFSVKSTELLRGNSLIPEFYFYLNVVKEKNIIKDIKYVQLNKYGVSDGEHSAIPRVSDGGIRYLYGRNIREGLIDFDWISDIPYIKRRDYETFTRTHIKENDVLIPIVGTIGKSAVYKQNYVGKAGIPRHIAHITIPENAEITPEYLSVFFRSKYGKTQLFSMTTGNIQPLLSLTNLKNVSVPIVSKEVMDTITKNESLANDLLSMAQEKLNKARNIFYEALGFDIKKIEGDFAFDVSSKEVFDKNIWSPNHYNTLYSNINQEIKLRLNCEKLGEIANCSHGVEVGSDNYKEYLDKQEEDYPFIRTSDIVNNEIDIYPDFYVDEQIAKDVENLPVAGDIIFSKDGKIGATAIITSNDKCIVSSGLEIIRLNEKGVKAGISTEYLFVVLSTKEVGYYEALKRTVVAATIPHLRPEKLKEIEIPIINDEAIKQITELVKKAYELKKERKPCLRNNDRIFKECFNKN